MHHNAKGRLRRRGAGESQAEARLQVLLTSLFNNHRSKYVASSPNSLQHPYARTFSYTTVSANHRAVIPQLPQDIIMMNTAVNCPLLGKLKEYCHKTAQNGILNKNELPEHQKDTADISLIAGLPTRQNTI